MTSRSAWATLLRGPALGLAAAVWIGAVSGCAARPAPESAAAAGGGDLETVSPPERLACDNARLTGYDELLVLAPHPDDEVLAFAGLISAYLEAGKPVEVVVVTDGDAYCDACRFWKSGSIDGPLCDASELSNFATPEIDSLAEVRRAESRAALEVLGGPEPVFLGYPDTGLAASWANLESGVPEALLRRSDFSAVADCSSGYGAGPETALTAESLEFALGERLARTSETALIATTHWLDGHGDHAGLGRWVRKLNGELDRPRALAYGVVHAHTPKDTPHFDCWYPEPRALECPCFGLGVTSAPLGRLAELREHRLRPSWPAALPDDADYGPESQLCLEPEFYSGAAARKLAAVRAYASQLGFAGRNEAPPVAARGLMDCNGYLLSFVRRSEAFVLVDGSR